MYWLIEDLEQLKVFYNSGYKEAFIEVIPFNNFDHPTQNNVSAVYVRPIEASKGFMVCSKHSETLGIELGHIKEVLKKFNKLLWNKVFSPKTKLFTITLINKEKIIKDENKNFKY